MVVAIYVALLVALAWPVDAKPPNATPQSANKRGDETEVVSRVIDRTPESLSFMATVPARRIENLVISGTSSYMATLTHPLVPGLNQLVYVDLIRGIWVGQKLNITSGPFNYLKPIEEVVVKSIGWDPRRKRNYFVADIEHRHPARSFVYQKHDVGGLTIESKSNADNQTQDLHVIRWQYGVGDSFAISAQQRYMSDVMSGLGDEGAIGINSEVIGELNSFHSTVHSVDWSQDALIFDGDGLTHPETLSTSRPLINLNEKKWITDGNVRVLNHYRPYKKKVYKPTSMGPFNDPGGAMIGSVDSGWTEAIVGRFLAITDPSEVISPNDTSTAGGYAKNPERVTRRWYQIVDFQPLSDGTSRIKILRVKWQASPASSPTLFLDDNYTWDGHDRPLSYAIAPGAWVYDISKGYDDAFVTGGYILDPDHPKLLRLAASPDRGTRFDFAPGDEIEQAVGGDPMHPVPIRIRQFDQFPDWNSGASIEINQLGRVQVPIGILFRGVTLGNADLEKRKDRKHSYGTLIRANVSANMGIDFSSEIASVAILFRQPNRTVQTQQWWTEKGSRTFYADPKSGHWRLEGGDVDINSHSMIRATGVSATGTPAKNLRGIDVAVPQRSVELSVRFPAREADARYALHVDSSWFTNHRVSSKSADGFTVEFSQPAPSQAKIDWMLIR